MTSSNPPGSALAEAANVLPHAQWANAVNDLVAILFQVEDRLADCLNSAPHFTPDYASRLPSEISELLERARTRLRVALLEVQ